MTLGESQVLTVLKILPSGEIQDTGYIYDVGPSRLAYDKKHKHLIIANPYQTTTTDCSGLMVCNMKPDYSLDLYSYVSTSYA
jgi:hypothetical protein